LHVYCVRPLEIIVGHVLRERYIAPGFATILLFIVVDKIQEKSVRAFAAFVFELDCVLV